ncbi:MAG: hypothetical protein E7478_10405 [Ruminococcaceae bacterium]|nr:hypothetical protein [Oscillospiraceae bacterium]
MAKPKNRLPNSIIILNIIMIVIVVVICVLLVSLLYGDQFTKEHDVPSVEVSSAATVEAESTAEAKAEPAATTTTKATSSVSMTKRTTEPTEPVVVPDEPDETEETVEYQTGVYSKDFFKDDLFIGDSITTGLHLFDRLDMKNVAADTGYTPYKAYTEAIPMHDGTSQTALDYAEKMQPKRIFIMLGSNGLAAAGPMEDSYKTLIEKLTVACPDTMLYCISVSPLAKGSTYESADGLNNEAVKKFNTFIKSICSEYGIRYIDLYSQLVGEDGYFLDTYAEVDGMHFKSATYDLMLAYIQDSIG